MPKNQLNFGKNLAMHALAMYYQFDVEKIKAEIETIQQEYVCDNYFIKKLYLKVQRTEINNVIIRSVLFCLSQQKQCLIEEKYKKGKTWTAISMMLYTSKPQLNIWHNEILDELVNMMLYKILPDNIYSREKVLNMIRILDQQIEILEKTYQDMVEEDILHMLKEKKIRFMELYEDMTKQMLNTIGINNKILLKKMELKNVTSQQIAYLCNVSEGSVSYCLKDYRKEILEKRNYRDLFA